MAAEGAVVSAEELLEKAWDENTDPFTNTVDDHHDAATQARRPARDRDGAAARAIGSDHADGPPPPDACSTRLLPVAGAALLAFNYFLVRNSLTDRRRDVVGSGARRSAAPRDPAARLPTTALSRLDVQFALAQAAMTAPRSLGWLVAGRALRPVQRSPRRRAASRTNLDERIALDGPDDELKELADTFDAMLDRLARRSTASVASSPTPATSCARR